MRIRKKEKIHPRHLEVYDTLTLMERHVEVTDDGTEYLVEPEKVLLTEAIGREMDIDTVVIFDIEPGDFGPDVKDGIGGAFLSTEGKNVQ